MRRDPDHGLAAIGPSRSSCWCAVSALTGEGLGDLRAAVEGVVTGGAGLRLDEPVLCAERHRALIEEALFAAQVAIDGIKRRAPEELVCEDIREAARALGRITGDELTPDLLDEIFSRFCIGK